MAKVVKVDSQSITVEMNSGKQKVYPIGAVTYENPEPGDEVKLVKDQNGNVFIDLPDEEVPAKQTGKAKGGKKEGRSGLGIAGFVIGIIAIIFSFIPIVNNIAFFIGILAAVFGLIGALTHKSKGLSIAGVVLGVLAIIITLALQSMWSKALDDASSQLDEAMESADTQLGYMSGENTEEILQNYLNVELGEFTMSKDQYGLVKSSLPVTVTNIGSESKNFSLHIEAIDSGNSRIMEDYVYANDLGAGQSQTFEVFQYIPDDKYNAMAEATFSIVEASMY